MNPEYQINTEDAVVTEIIVNAEKGILVEKVGLRTLISTAGEKTFHILGEIKRDEIMIMAESLKYFSK